MRAGELIAERFALDRVAGSGGMGTVYRARDTTMGQVVAVKVLQANDPLRTERFSREARILAQLSHPGIVRYIAHGTTFAGEMYLVMEWLEGEDLAQRLQRQPLSLEESVAMAARVADALAAAHAVGVVHRDLKPSNLFLPDADIARVKLLDFGVARMNAGGGNGVRDQTLTSGRVGTPRYMSPEQARGEKEIDARADIFSLGCVLYACLTGRAAFLGDDEIGVLAKILLEDPPRPREVRPIVPRPLDDLVMRMLAKDPSMRPQGGAALAAELKALESMGVVDRSLPGEPKLALGDREQRLLCVVLAPRPPRSDDSDAITRQLPGMSGADDAALRRAVDRHGAHMEPLHDGGFVVTLTGSGSATDQAANAARCALSIRAAHARATMALSTGRGVLAHRLPVGDVIDRAVVLLRGAPIVEGAAAVRIDELTAGLLGPEFDVRGDGGAGLLLHGERDVQEVTRTLLGKPSACVGREREIGVLCGLFDECVAERVARAVLITAPAGVGKSRLRQEFIKVLGARAEAEVWIGRGDPLRAGSPFGMLAPPIRRAAGILYGEAAQVARQKLRARVSRHVEAAEVGRISEFIGELLAIPFPEDASVQLRAARSDAMLMGDQMRRAWEDWLSAECAAQPVVIVLEDLQWGDAPSVGLVDAALRNLRDRPLLVLALARPEVGELFPDLWEKRGLTKMHLGELTARASEKLVRDVLGDSVPRVKLDSIVQRAAGNALYLEELIRSVAEGRGDELPETILAMVQARLEHLPSEARRVLRAASVFGDVFWKGGVVALAGGARRATGIDEWLTELVLREVVTRRRESRFPGEIEYVFRHSMVREAAYASLTDKDRQLAHRVAGEWLVQVGEVDALVLAEHTERGGEPYHAVGYYRRAAEQALEGNDFASALLRADRGVACGAKGEVLGALRRLQAEAHRWRAENAAAEFRGLEAMRVVPRGSALWYEAVGEVAIAAGRRGNQRRMMDLVETVRRVGEGTTTPAARVATLARLTVEMLLLGQPEMARALQREVEEGAVHITPAPSVTALVHAASAHVARQRGDLVTFVRRTEAAVECFQEAGALRTSSLSRANLALGYIDLGEYERADALLRDTLTVAERMGLAHLTAIAKHNLGLALARLGDLAGGRKVEEEALALASAQGNRRFEGGAHAYLAIILGLAGELDAAEREARAAVQVLSAAPPLRPLAQAVLTHVLLAQHRVREAMEEVREVVPLLESNGVEEQESLVRLAHAEVLHALGDLDGARKAIQLARARILARAELLVDEPLRRSFLTRVPENAKTIQLAKEWRV